MQANEIDRARDALYSLTPDLPRDQWVKAGMGAHTAGLGFDDFDQWSAAGASYDAQACRATWRSFKASPGGVGAGALFGMARDHGWADNSASDRPAPRPERATTRPPEPPRKPANTVNAEMVWGRCTPVKSHPYATAKGASPEAMAGLRVVPDGDALRIMGESMAGALVVPCWAADGALSTLQFITAGATAERLKAAGRATKLNLHGASVNGWFTVGDLKTSQTVYIVEGVGQAWACWQATGGAAVVAFGAGNMAKVATALRQQDEYARLVLVADRGKEKLVQDIAAEVAGQFVFMPECEENNFDANDLFLRDGFDTLAALLESATAPPKPEPKVHPLARFIDLDVSPKPPKWVIPGFIGHGLTVIAGAHGVGKTTALLPLAMVAAGLHQEADPLAPKQWRHVVYVVEDVEQARRILAAIIGFGGLGLDAALVRERLHIVEAKRLDAAFVAEVGKVYREHFSRMVGNVQVLPLVVFDTKSAVIAMDEENSNTEGSRIVALLKQGFEELPVWLIGHIAKQNIGRSDAASLSLRGAGAFEGDATQVLYLIQESEARYLVRGKTRFEALWPELEITSHCASTVAADEFGNMETVMLRWAHCSPPTQSRKEASNQAAEQRQAQEAAQLRDDVREAVDVAWLTGFPFNRTMVRTKVKHKTTEVADCIELLLAERWLHEVHIPVKIRTHPKKASFLVNLSTVEHEEYIRTGVPPAAKAEIPQSWMKPPIEDISSVPAPEQGIDSLEACDAAQ